MKTILTRSILYLAVLLWLGLSIAFAAEQTHSELITQAKVSQEKAEKIALAKVPNGKIESAELEKEHGKLIWSFDISMPKSKNIIEVQVNAKTGKIVSIKTETPKDQAKEVAADKLQKK